MKIGNKICNNDKPVKLNSGDMISSEYFVMDIETTGLNEKFGQIVEMYCAVIKDNEMIMEFHEQFWSPIWWKTKKLHQIPKSELKGKPKFMSKKNLEKREALKNLFKRCCNPNDDLVFIAQYAKFEKKWMEQKLNIDLTDCKTYDTWSVEKMLYPDLTHNLIDMSKRRGIVSPNEHYDFHRAKQDVEATLQVMESQIKTLKENGDISGKYLYDYIQK